MATAIRRGSCTGTADSRRRTTALPEHVQLDFRVVDEIHGVDIILHQTSRLLGQLVFGGRGSPCPDVPDGHAFDPEDGGMFGDMPTRSLGAVPRHPSDRRRCEMARLTTYDRILMSCSPLPLAVLETIAIHLPSPATVTGTNDPGESLSNDASCTCARPPAP